MLAGSGYCTAAVHAQQLQPGKLFSLDAPLTPALAVCLRNLPHLYLPPRCVP